MDQQLIINHINNLYKQLEQYHALVDYLKPPYPLPPMRGWAISPDFGRLIIDTVNEHKPKTIVELGSGVSTLMLGLIKEKAGIEEIISVDHDDKFCEETRRRLVNFGIDQNISLNFCPLKEQAAPNGDKYQWYDISGVKFPKKIDLLIVDGPPGNLQPLSRYMAYPAFADNLSKGSLILVDDAAREDEQNMVKKWASENPGIMAEGVPCEKGAIKVLFES